jgi:Fe-S oxidoreductase
MRDEPGVERPSHNRIRDTADLGGLEYFVIACPNDAAVFSDAVKTSGNRDMFEVKEIAELRSEALLDVPLLVGGGKVIAQDESSLRLRP